MRLSVGIRFQEGVEVPHRELVSPNNPHVGNGLAVFVKGFYRRNHIVQMLFCQAASVDCKADDIREFGLLLRRFQIVLHRKVAELSDADSVPAD